MAAFAAVDLGARSGRVAVGRFRGSRLSVDVVHRFSNVRVEVGGRLRWDAPSRYTDVLAGLAIAARTADIVSVGVDAWAVDFGLIERDGTLLELPVHYRDSRRAQAYDAVIDLIGARTLYDRTGIQLMRINTIFELASMAADGDPGLARADRLLLLPDLFHHWLCGSRTTEFTNATTTQCLDIVTRRWAVDIVERLSIPSHLFPDVVEPATVLGPVEEERSGIRGATVVAGATHDTAAAVAGTPLPGRHAAFLSVGTWSLVGIEAHQAVTAARAYTANITNEGGVDDTVRILRNVTGLWLLDECRRSWAADGHNPSLEELLASAEVVAPLQSIVEPNDPTFVEPGDMPARIAAYCARTGQRVPGDDGAYVRCILESIALKHAAVIDTLVEVTDRRIDELYLVGGGAQNRLLCQWTAEASGRPVFAGPVEATLVGNVLVQAIATGELASLEEARLVTRDSFASVEYEPEEGSGWLEARERFAALPCAALGAGG